MSYGYINCYDENGKWKYAKSLTRLDIRKILKDIINENDDDLPPQAFTIYITVEKN